MPIDCAFYNCSGLTSVTIGNGVTSIGNYAFSGCSGLTSVTIPDSVTTIGGGAFEGCSGLTSITIPDGVTFIGDSAFKNCTELMSIILPFIGKSKTANNGYDQVFGYIFGFTTSYSVGTTKQYETVSGSYYYYIPSSLRKVVLSDNVTSIGDSAFYSCSGLTSIIIPNSVTSIGGSAFSGCSGLTSITIPDGVTSIGNYAFSGCKNLKYNEYDNALYLGNENNPYLALIKAKTTDITSCIVNEKCKVVGSATFSAFSKLTSITIPDSVTNIGGGAFYNCSGLMSVTIGNGVTSIGDSAFRGCVGLKEMRFTGTISQWKTMSKGSDWNKGVSASCKVICTDGETSL